MLKRLWYWANGAPLWAVEMFGLMVVAATAELTVRTLRGWLAIVALVIVLAVNRAIGYREGVRDTLEKAE